MLDSRTILNDPDVIVVDNSILTATATCPTLAALRYALDVTMDEDRAPLQAGHMAHEVLAAHLRGETADAALAVPAFVEYMAWATDAVELNDRLAPDNVKAILQRWLETHPLATLPFQVDPTLVEVGFAVPLDHNIVFVGRMDALAQDAGGAHYVVEHKAQPLDASVLTPIGFRRFGDLRVGDPVVGRDGAAHVVTGVYPQGTLPAYKVRLSDGGETVCSADHLWTVSDFSFRKVTTMPLSRIMAAPSHERFHLPVMAPIQFCPSGVAPLDPYLVGALLGDGYLAGTCVQYSGADSEQIALVATALPPGDVLRKGGGRYYTWTVKGGRTMRAIEQLGLRGRHSWSKFVPGRYKHGTIAERSALLQGLLDTDGNVYNGHVSYTSVSERLACDVVDLVRSLGGTARLRKRSSTKHQAYHVSIRLSTMTPFRLTRKARALKPLPRPECRIIESIDPINAMSMQCISVSAPDGLYVTDDYIVTHNTTGRLDERWRKRHRTSAQITGYVWAAQQYLQQPVAGCFVNGIEFARLPTDTKKCRTHGVPYPECGPQHARFDLLIEHRAPHQIDAWVDAARKLARRYAHLKATVPSLNVLKDVPMHGQFTGACPDCQFMDFCRVGRPAASAAAMMRVEPWSPFAHAFAAP